MKTKVITIMMVMMALASVSMYAGGYDYRGVWILDTVGGYMSMDNPKNRISIIPSETTVILRNENGKILTYYGSVRITDEDHIIITDSDDKKIKLVREDYAIYAKAIALEKTKQIAGDVGTIVLEVVLFTVLSKLLEYGLAAVACL